MAKPDNISALLDFLQDLAKQVTEALKPQWEARRDVAKTIISLSSATLVFTITFASSFVKPDIPSFWRYAVLVCWLAFVCSLILSLASLWLAIGINDLPAQVLARAKDFNEATKEYNPQVPLESDPIYAVFNQEFQHVVHKDINARRLFNASLICFGIALVVFVSLGVRHLLV